MGEFGEFFVPSTESAPTEKDYVTGQAARWLEECERLEMLPAGIVERLLGAFSRPALLSLRQACLVHGDFGPQNVIVERGAFAYHVTGFVEFECARGGSPEADMRWVLSQSTQDLPGLRKGFLDGYAETGTLGTQFWDRVRLYRALANLKALARAHGEGHQAVAEQNRQMLIQYAET
jgi:aminoglycoside phosphotransferase (APT) family kinase protein